MEKKYLPIPEYTAYGVSKNGEIISFVRNKILSQSLLNGYWTVYTFRGSKTKTLPVHRAVALAWVDNINPEQCTVVNHIDGNKENNSKDNLEWTDYQGNNDHALGTGLRTDNIPVIARDYITGNKIVFDSLADGLRFVDLPPDSSQSMLMPTRFGALVGKRYEFRFLDDPRPWFYEGREERITPSRHWIKVVEEDGSEREFFRGKDLLKAYQLYKSEKRGVADLVSYAQALYPGKTFTHVDSFKEPTYRQRRYGKLSKTIPVIASDGVDTLSFDSVTQCAKHFRTSRFHVLSRLDSDKTLYGWSFTHKTVCSSGDG